MASTTITPAFLNSIAAVKFANSTDVNNYFKAKTGALFPAWFNANIAMKNYWGVVGNRQGVQMATDTDLQNRFNMLWNNTPILFGTAQINLLQFVSLMSIVNNETGGTIRPITEKVGNSANPGLSYAFNKISGIKRSYNTLPSNKTAYDLFHDANYTAQFGTLALASSLKNTTNTAWKGEVYPAGISTSTDPAQTGFIIEADFFKFRGRGFIQTTTRGNYSSIVSFVQKYNGSNALIKQYKTKWTGKTPDIAATISSNNDWDSLFQNTDLIIASEAINIHNNAAGNYLGKITLTPGVETNIRAMGKAISGANDYADLFLNRVIQVLDGLGN